MTQDSCPKVSEEPVSTTAASITKQRKKRKWDQPAESLISAGLALPGVLPLGNMGTLVGMTVPGVALLSGTRYMNKVPVTCATIPQISLAPSVQPNAAAVVQKLNQPKIQDELIAREIVINDAEPTVRYRLTKRQTQEEIQRCTGAVVITRGKYRPLNALPDTEKPLYLHISAGAHLKEMAERIKAVDRAAAMVEVMLRPGHISNPINNGGQVPQLLNALIFLGFDADPSLNIAVRVRGPNDQYINHIMNETGVTVILRGRGSGSFESQNGEESQQPLHLYLTGSNPKSLERAKLLAENLMDTIAAECGASRVFSCKVYNTVPPPQQLLDGVQSSGIEERLGSGPVASLASSTAGSTPVPSVSSAAFSRESCVFPPGTVPQPGGSLSCGQPHPNMGYHPQPSVGGTSYIGYGGIYPQATPLQQVALALRQSPSPAISVTRPVTPAGSTFPKVNSKIDTEKRFPQRRKFQELPAASKGTENPLQNSMQGSGFYKPDQPSEDSNLKSFSTMSPPKVLVQLPSKGTPPPPPRTMPPPPPKFMSSTPLPKADGDNLMPTKSTSKPVPDTLFKLMEYGEDEDEEEIPGTILGFKSYVTGML